MWFYYDYIVEVKNRFKGLDLIERLPDELWTEVRDIVQETGIKTIPKKKKCKKAKWLSEEALQIAGKGREAKSKGEKERDTHLNAEVQRITRRDKKAFLSDQCKEIEENNRMGKTRDLFKKCSLGISNFLEEIYNTLVFHILLFSSISLHQSLRKAFLSLLAILWNSTFRWVYISFSLLPLASLLFSAICKALSDNHFAFLFLGDGPDPCLLYNDRNLHP